MTEIDPDRREDIKDAFIEAAVKLRMARAGAKLAEQETSERDVRYTVLAIRDYLDDIDGILQELEGLVEAAFGEQEPEPEEIVQKKTPRGAAAREARTGRGARGRRPE